MRAEDSLLWLRRVPFWNVLTEIKVFTWFNTDLPLLPKTHKVLHSETFQTPPWFGLETVEIISPLCQSFVVYAWVFENTRGSPRCDLTTLLSYSSFWCAHRPVLCRVVLRHTVLSWALHLGHVGPLPSAACVWNRALCWEESSIIRAVFYLKTVTWAAAILRGFDASQHSSLIEVIRPPTNF